MVEKKKSFAIEVFRKKKIRKKPPKRPLKCKGNYRIWVIHVYCKSKLQRKDLNREHIFKFMHE